MKYEKSRLPPAARLWPDWVKDRFIERVAIMREGNRIPETDETPMEIYLIAADAAEEDLKLT